MKASLATDPRSSRYGPPSRADVLPIVLAGVALALLLGALAWLLNGWSFPPPAIAEGLGSGLLLVVAWSLRDGLLRGEPRVEQARQVSLWLLLAGALLALAAFLQGVGAALIWACTAAVVFDAWLLFVLASTARVSREVEAPLRTVGIGHAGRALIIYHSAAGGLMRAMQEAFAAGLEEQGWTVDLSTASRISPDDLAAYRLLVIGSPCYNRGVSRPVRAYLDRVGDLKGIPVVIVVTGFNYTERAMAVLRALVESRHGNVVDQIELWTARENVPRYGTRDLAEIMRRAGAYHGKRLRASAA